MNIPESSPNLEVTGDEARLLMMALATSDANLQAKSVINMWIRLGNISQVQPPSEEPTEDQ